MGIISSRRIRVQMHDAGGRKVEIAVTPARKKARSRRWMRKRWRRRWRRTKRWRRMKRWRRRWRWKNGDEGGDRRW